MSTRRCPAFKCTTQIADYELTCSPHWFEVPKELRDRVWHTYKRAKEHPADHDISAKHRANVMEVIRFLQAEPADEPVDA